jgi:hypothetical protein
MLETSRSRRIDTTYNGHRLAPWLLALVASVKVAQSLFVLFGGDFVVRTADVIPLDAYTPAGAQTVLSLFMLLGFDRLLIGLLAVPVLVRYRGMIAPMFTLLLLHDMGKQLIFHLFPIVRVGAPPGPTVNLVLFGLTIVGLALSLWNRGAVRAESV